MPLKIYEVTTRIPAIILFTLIMLLNVLPKYSYSEVSIDIDIVRLSSRDKSAVVKTQDNTMVIAKVGDLLPGIGTIDDILSDRIVLTKKTEAGSETITIRMVNGQQKVEKILSCPAPASSGISRNGNKTNKQ